MANFTMAIAAVKSAYDTYRTAGGVTLAASDAIVGAGPEPTPPSIIAADSDWNNYVTSNQSWLATNVTLQANLVAAKASQRTAELAVIAALGYNTGDVPNSIALNEWVHVVGAGGGLLTYNHYIGAASNSTYLVISTFLPTQAFPNT